jgi:3'-phosphoadenosine 5'-phosphosulfate (PAPS) 3'-phosphatase
MYEEELAFAHALADEASTIAMDLFADDGLEIRHKADRTLVTAADLAIERMVRTNVEQAFPGDASRARRRGRHVRRRGPRVDRRPDRRHRQLRTRDPVWARP